MGRERWVGRGEMANRAGVDAAGGLGDDQAALYRLGRRIARYRLRAAARAQPEEVQRRPLSVFCKVSPTPSHAAIEHSQPVDRSRGVTLGKQAAFKTNPITLEELLRHCGSGTIQLPDFQRSWVWDEERIKGLVASISQAFPVGALMTLEVKPGAAGTFARRLIQGAEAVAASAAPDQLLLDGQQRMTSLYQACLRGEVVQTVTPRLKLVKRWFYIDIRKAMNPAEDREKCHRFGARGSADQVEL